jgi:hypothetical protein
MCLLEIEHDRLKLSLIYVHEEEGCDGYVRRNLLGAANHNA